MARAMDSTRGIALGGWWPLCIAAWLAAPPARGDCLESEPPAGSGLEEISPSISYVYFVGKYYGYFVGKYYGYFVGKYYGYFVGILWEILRVLRRELLWEILRVLRKNYYRLFGTVYGPY